ncbi:hypothetical protein Acr_03g0007110 [Actinidia rufa]|uniref:GTP diphosphokinase n=1 Tax=Actinidia rufa TaxID=165716 RepID=A0A7J0EE69_9ERIC|nr:hypothetical protein Acr_03g0007110 [Actinidia rufa]
MCSRQTSSIFRKNPYLLHNPNRILRDSMKSLCVLDQIVPKFTVASSLNAVFTSANVIAAAAAAGSGSVHGAVTSALTHVAVTAVAIASGACLSTKVDFLWPKVEEQPGALILDGVDVTGYPIFYDSKVQKAIAFARKAHHGQLRKTGDPYLTHCIHTGKIIAVLVPTSGKRAVDTVVAAILHDVVDDTSENLDSVEREFGDDVAKLVAAVSRLSYINQLLRRHRRVNMCDGTLGHEEANNLRVMLLGMVDDPRVVLIKLADRLHNMRTIYALPSAKAHAVAQETLVIWCSIASRLGLWPLKAELEDLCFAVLEVDLNLIQFLFRKCHYMEGSKTPGILATGKAIFEEYLQKASLVFPSTEKDPTLNYERSAATDKGNTSIRDLLQAVLPFDVLLDRRKRINFLRNIETCSESQSKPKVVRDAGIALASMVLCEEALERELFISTSYVPGMEVTLSSRLKSLYSIYSKMKRKEVGINKVYDARALRVIVGDKNGTLHGEAVQSCYSLLNTVHRLWTPVDGEFDDYIVNPKPSGYQSLHTAVQGPDNSPLEVQIRTQRMHEYAEHGLAAHWLYKETEDKFPSIGNIDDSEITASPYISEDIEHQSSIEDDTCWKYSSLKAGHPVLRVDGKVDKGGRELLVAVSFGLTASEAVADRRSSNQTKRWEAYARLYKKGHGDWFTCLEKYTLCRDGIYHKQDQFQRLLPTYIQVIDLTEREETEYWDVMSSVFEGKQVVPITSNSSSYERPGLKSLTSISVESGINNKVQLLRTMLQWEEQLRSEAGNSKSVALGEVVIVCWPHGEVMRLISGSTAADAARRVGLEGKLVSVNGQLVLPNTQLKDGDVVEVRM